MCTLSSFIKQAERGQLEARSIASPCMFFRVIVTAVEQFVSILLECNNESAVGKNSVEKVAIKRSLTAQLKRWRGILTGDNSKWNETTSNLTSGRQTYDLLMDSNIPAPQAF